MGEVIQYHSKEQIDILHNIEMYRLLYLFEVVNYVKSFETTAQKADLDSLKTIPLITCDHYKFIVENLRLPDEILKSCF